MKNINTFIEFLFLKNNFILKELKKEDKICVKLLSEQEEKKGNIKSMQKNI